MKTAALLVTTPLALLAVLILSSQRFENTTSEFATYQDMVASGIIEAGWVPTYIPESARSIWERHNIDSNRVEMTFRFVPGDTSKPDSLCKVVHSEAAARKYLCPPYDLDTSVLLLRSDGSGQFARQ